MNRLFDVSEAADLNMEKIFIASCMLYCSLIYASIMAESLKVL
ncbi:MAG: hypothetical protein JWQ21_944 [Herminiimonas sp.]|nr:hypothetical protein [Herminiimonas sp.]